MIIILKNIPATTTNNDIENFIKPTIKGGLLSRSGRIERISILTQKDGKTDKVECHGLVTISPDSAAIKAIKKLNRKRINGRNILVVEYRIRHWHNDPRLNRDHLVEAPDNRRKGDRRRRHLEVKKEKDVKKENLAPLFSSEQKFHKKLDA